MDQLLAGTRLVMRGAGRSRANRVCTDSELVEPPPAAAQCLARRGSRSESPLSSSSSLPAKSSLQAHAKRLLKLCRIDIGGRRRRRVQPDVDADVDEPPTSASPLNSALTERCPPLVSDAESPSPASGPATSERLSVASWASSSRSASLEGFQLPPLALEPALPGARGRRRSSTRALCGCCFRVLIADDEAVNRALAKRAFALACPLAEISLASDGKAALEAFSESEGGPIDACVLDFEMPRLTGPEAARSMRDLEAASRRPPALIVAWTSLDVSFHGQSGFDMGFRKPCPLADVVRGTLASLRHGPLCPFPGSLSVA